MKLKFKMLDKRAHVPVYKSMLAAGFDLCVMHDTIIIPGVPTLVKTGLAVEIPKGYEMQIRPRSGLSIKYPNYICNSPGTVDADYRGELKIIICIPEGKIWRMKAGDRIAQGVISRVEQCEIEVATDLSETERGSDGFGSTG